MTAEILSRFPKSRPPLPAAYQAIYEAQYKENREGESTAASLAQRLESWMHHQVAADSAALSACATLELGAGTLNQLPYEAQAQAYDVVEPFTALFAGSPRLERVRDVYADIAEIPEHRRYGRIISVAVLEHIADLPQVLARSARMLESDGVFRAAIPAEGGFLWKLGWSLTTGLEYRLRHGLDYGVMMAHEHLNTAAEIEALVSALFGEVKIRSFGIGRQLSLYRFIEARKPDLKRASDWL